MSINIKIDTKKALEELKSLTEIHMELNKKMDEYMKNSIWIGQEIIRKRTRDSINKMAELGILNGELPKNWANKIYFKSSYVGYKWFFYCEPEWYWGEQYSYRFIHDLFYACKSGTEAGSELRKKMIKELK